MTANSSPFATITGSWCSASRKLQARSISGRSRLPAGGCRCCSTCAWTPTSARRSPQTNTGSGPSTRRSWCTAGRRSRRNSSRPSKNSRRGRSRRASTSTGLWSSSNTRRSLTENVSAGPRRNCRPALFSSARQEKTNVAIGIRRRTLLASLLAGVPSLRWSGAAQAQGDPLPSWNDGAVKKSITGFVARVITPGGGDFVPLEQRIAVFDNDGTLWCEQPVYFQVVFAFDEVRRLAPQHPEWKKQQPFKNLLEGKMQLV